VLVTRILIVSAVLAGVAVGQPPDPIAAAKQRTRNDNDAEAALLIAANAKDCKCTAGRVVLWKDAASQAHVKRVPVVVFVGCEPRCCAEAIPVKMTVEEDKMIRSDRHIRPDKPIVVYVPTGDGRLIQATDMPKTATTAEVKAAVTLAKKSLDKK